MAESQDTLSPNKQALLKIRELKQRLAEAEQQRVYEPIAVVSMACRFPRTSNTPEAFWESLIQQTDEVSEIPADRWDLDAFHNSDPDVPGKMYARHGVFLDGIDQMDPEFFGISPREATWVDPQQRLLMEVGWEALERAGWVPAEIGESTGVFVGWMHNDYQNEASDSFLNLNPYIATGAAGSFLSGRLAYYLGLQGPSLAVDTACSSSLVALHLACHSLQRGDCDRALVGGVNAICSPTTNILTCKLKALSPRGHSRAFDAEADGYLRGEGCGVVAIRRLADAERDGDHILGVIRGSAVGHNGFSSGLTAPNPRAQEKVIRQAVQRARLSPSDISYLEAHGTGTELGDPIELRAAAAALAADRNDDAPLLTGSVKTNIGHLEAAAGMAGLIKVLLSIQHDRIPGQLNFDTPNPHIAWDQLAVRVLTETSAWPREDARIAGVSAFGMSGTNAHVVVSAPEATTTARATTTGRAANDAHGAKSAAPQLITVSARNEDALRDLAAGYRTALASATTADLKDIAYTSNCRRQHFKHRAAIVATTTEDAAEAFDLLARGGSSDALSEGSHRHPPKTAWQFTGQGSQYVGMARGLYDSEPLFRNAVDDCDQKLGELRVGSTSDGLSLKQVLFEHPDAINQTEWTQPCIFAVQRGLAALLQSYGLVPDVVMGHSVGQYAAACVAGILSWDDGLKLIAERGRLIGSLPSGGSMLAVFAPLNTVEQELTAASAENDAFSAISVAANNGTHIVISGSAELITQMIARFDSRSMRTKTLATSHAFHSDLMNPALGPFEEFARSVTCHPARIPLVCNVSGEVLDADTILDGAYWSNHIRAAVRYAESVETIQEIGCDVVLELGPQGILSRMAAANWKQPADRIVSCLERNDDNRTSLLKAMGRLYTHGTTPGFTALYEEQHARPVVLPTYPFQRTRYWGPDKPRALHAEFHTAHPLLGAEVSLAGSSGEKRYETFIEPDSPPWLPDHEVMDQVVVPGAAWVEIALAAAGEAWQLTDVTFEQPLRPVGRTALQTVVRTDENKTQTVETWSRAGEAEWQRHVSATLTELPPADQTAPKLETLQHSCGPEIQAAAFYARMREIGLKYGPDFQVIQHLQFDGQQVLARLEPHGDVRGFRIPPTLLDGALHCLAVALLQDDDGHLFLPVGIDQVRCYQSIQDEVWCHGTWTQHEGQLRSADLILFETSGKVVAEITGLRLQQINRAALRQMSGAGAERLLHTMDWEPLSLPPITVQNGHWAIVCDTSKSELPQRVATELKDRGFHVDMFGLEDGVAELATRASQQATIQGIAWFLTDHAQANCEGLLNLVASLELHGPGSGSLEFGLQLVTDHGIATPTDAACNPHQAQYWGLGRVIGAEQPGLRCRLIDTGASQTSPAETSAALTTLLLTETQDNQLALRADQFLVPRLMTSRQRTSAAFEVSATGSYLITGGLGMLGRQAAKWLAEAGATQVVLVSRRAPDDATQTFLNQLQTSGCDVIVQSVDLTSDDAVTALIAEFGSGALKPLTGVIHAAGVLDDALLGDQTWERFEKVMAPKVTGARLLHEHTRELPLDFFILYSSAASVLGSPGQSNYATGNAFLDGLAWERRCQGLPATSINWGPWTEGMADDERIVKRLALQGITPLTVSEAHSAMEKMLLSDITQATVMDVEWHRLRMGAGTETPTFLERLVTDRPQARRGHSEFVGRLRQLSASEGRQLLLTTVQDALQQILSTTDKPETDRPLIEMGLDSLMAVEFGTALQQLLGDEITVGPTMLFEHPTIDAIVDHVYELVSADSDSDVPEAATQQTEQSSTASALRTREPVAIIGMSCRFPGADNVDEFWHNILNGVDSVREIPDDRWDIDRFYSDEREPGRMYTREGGFLEDIGNFDADFFNISAVEACWIDPQHRMLLENSYRALEDAAICPSPLADANVGVFMGIMGQDYAFLPRLDDEDVIKAFEGAGLSHSAGVGRISYVFGFEGPSVAVDTASSSSLVALYQAVRSLQDGNCNMALAGGVNAILAPVNSLLMSRAGLLSPDGRCKSFSAAADGFGRGEGCGVVVLKRLSDAQRDGDRIMAVVRGGAVVHNGFSGGITSPSGKAQARVISQALNDADVAPSQVQYLEAHGTGTELGDPMELAAATSVYGKGRKRDSPLLVGSVKANISHLEAAGGVSGLIKTVLALHHGVIPPQAHFDEPSRHIPWQRLPAKIVTERTPWPETDERLAGVTALGLVGTNAHIVLSGAPAQNAQPDSTTTADNAVTEPMASENTDTQSTDLLLLSARTETALAELVSRYAQLLQQDDAPSVADICFTAATGRRHYEHRIAVTANSRDELTRNLNAFTGSGLQNDVVQSELNGQPHLCRVGTAHQNVQASGGQCPPYSPETDAVRLSHGIAAKSPRLAWVFHDTEVSPGVAQNLYRDEPMFRKLIADFDERLSSLESDSTPSLQEWLQSPDDKDDSQAPPKELQQFVIHAGLATLFQHWGILPDIVTGFGIGQYTAACVAGCLSFADAATLVAARAAMADRPDESELSRFEALADTFNYYPPNLPLICSLTGDIMPVHRSPGGSYWREHLTSASRQTECETVLAKQNADFTVVFGTDQTHAMNVADRNGAETSEILLPVQANEPVSSTTRRVVGRLYVGGLNPDFATLCSHGNQRVSLPLYPFEKKRYWITEVAQHVDEEAAS